MGIEPPRDGRLLRELCALGNRIQSHVLHQLLVLDDFVEEEKEKVEAIKRIQQIRKIGQYVVVDDLVDETVARPQTFFEGRGFGHLREQRIRAAGGLHRQPAQR